MNIIENNEIILDNIIKYIYVNWNGYLSAVYWGLYPNDKTPEMLILEYKDVKFYPYYYNPSNMTFFRPYKNNYESSLDFSEKLIESKNQTADIFGFDTYYSYKYYIENTKNLKDLSQYFKSLLKQKYDEIDFGINTENCDRFYNFD